MPTRQNLQSLGQTRDRAPCLPPALLSCFAALPLQRAGDGHPGILYVRRDQPDDAAETLVEASPVWLRCTACLPGPCPPSQQCGNMRAARVADRHPPLAERPWYRLFTSGQQCSHL